MITGNWENRTVFIDGKKLSPRRSLTIVNHSPDGFSWGYAGSGPAQLALAILLKFSGEKFARTYYQAFKFDIIRNLPHGDFVMTGSLVTDWIKKTTVIGALTREAL